MPETMAAAVRTTPISADAAAVRSQNWDFFQVQRAAERGDPEREEGHEHVGNAQVEEAHRFALDTVGGAEDEGEHQPRHPEGGGHEAEPACHHRAVLVGALVVGAVAGWSVMLRVLEQRAECHGPTTVWTTATAASRPHHGQPSRASPPAPIPTTGWRR